MAAVLIGILVETIKTAKVKKQEQLFFDTDKDFQNRRLLPISPKIEKKEPKETKKAPCMIIFCSWQQLNELREYAEQFGFKHAQPLFFIKKSSSQVLKANMRARGVQKLHLCYIVKLPKFNNNGKMILDWFEWDKSGGYPKVHPTQKPVSVLKG